MNERSNIRWAVLALLLGACSIEPGKQPWNTPPAPPAQAEPAERAPCADHDLLRKPLFGDLHVHTGLSMDARTSGTIASPEDAYRYARGEPLRLPSRSTDGASRSTQIDRPLHFAAVTDHAEWLGETALCSDPTSEVYETDSCRIFRGEEESLVGRILGLRGARSKYVGILSLWGRNTEVCGADLERCERQARSTWQQIQDAAERFYDRSSECSFTTFHGFEYSRSPANTKVHRNVLFRNEIVPDLPISWIDTPTEPEFWRKLRERCNDSGSGCDAIAIPHNPNLSNGQLFDLWYRDLPLDEQRSQAKLRAGLEPIVEMVQYKGESECRNGMYGVVGGNDELCDFEKVRDMPGSELEDCKDDTGSGAQAGRGCTSRLDYVRYALAEGVREEERIGVNPYRFGFIGSTDTHQANPGAVAEDRAIGSLPTSQKDLLTIGDRRRASIFRSAGGLAGVWAEENSRESIFDALQRRETFATSGPRIAPRLFGGWNLPEDACDRPDLVEMAYAQAVPMGSDLSDRPDTATTPRFVVSALRDAEGGLLQRAQIIKVWPGENGEIRQAVYEVAGDPNNGATVDVGTCTPRGTGADSLCGFWEDPAFEPEQPAVYYARIVENPSCRWSTWSCFGLAESERPDGCSDPRVPKTIQERAWTSPIWWRP